MRYAKNDGKYALSIITRERWLNYLTTKGQEKNKQRVVGSNPSSLGIFSDAAELPTLIFSIDPDFTIELNNHELNSD